LEGRFFLLSRIDIAAQKSDVRAYVESELDKNKRMRLHVAKDPNLRSEIVNALSEKADGMYVCGLLSVHN